MQAKQRVSAPRPSQLAWVDYLLRTWCAMYCDPTRLRGDRGPRTHPESGECRLNAKSVSGAGHSTKKDDEYCKIYGGKEESWRYQLSNGFNVYWEQRKKARPLVLRLIQTLFGN